MSYPYNLRKRIKSDASTTTEQSKRKSLGGDDGEKNKHHDDGNDDNNGNDTTTLEVIDEAIDVIPSLSPKVSNPQNTNRKGKRKVSKGKGKTAQINSNTKLATVTVEQQSEEQKEEELSFQCKEHPSEKLRLFCSSPSCMKPVCIQCVTEDHKNHDFNLIKNAFDYYRKSVLLHVETVKGILVQTDKEMENVTNQLSSFENEKQTAAQNVKDSFNKIREWITKRETELLESINTSTQTISNELLSSQQNLHTLSSTTQQSVNEIESHLSKINLNNSNSDTFNQLEFLKNTKKYTNNLDSSISTLQQQISNKNNHNQPFKHNITFEEFDSHTIQSFISKIGNIVKSVQLNIIKEKAARDYTLLLPNGNQKCKRVYGPELGDGFRKFNYSYCITIVPKHWFEITKSDNDNCNPNSPLASSSSSSQPSQKQQPFSSDDLLAISDCENHRIVLMEKTSGKVKSMIGSGKPGNQTGELNCPVGTAVTFSSTHPNLILLVADQNNNRIQSFDIETGKYLNHFTHNKYIKEPWGICVEPTTTNQIFVANYKTHTITIHTGYPNTNSNNNNNNNHTQFGTLLRVIGDGKDGIIFDRCNDVKINSKGDLIVSSYHKIDILDGNNNYTLVKSFGSKGDKNGEFLCPFGVCVDALDNILVCDLKNHRVQIFDKNGNWINSLGKKGNDEGSFSGPVSISIDNENGDIWVCDGDNHRVMMF